MTHRHQRSHDALDHVGFDCFFFSFTSLFLFFFCTFFLPDSLQTVKPLVTPSGVPIHLVACSLEPSGEVFLGKLQVTRRRNLKELVVYLARQQFRHEVRSC